MSNQRCTQSLPGPFFVQVIQPQTADMSNRTPMLPQDKTEQSAGHVAQRPVTPVIVQQPLSEVAASPRLPQASAGQGSPHAMIIRTHLGRPYQFFSSGLPVIIPLPESHLGECPLCTCSTIPFTLGDFFVGVPRALETRGICYEVWIKWMLRLERDLTPSVCGGSSYGLLHARLSSLS